MSVTKTTQTFTPIHELGHVSEDTCWNRLILEGIHWQDSKIVSDENDTQGALFDQASLDRSRLTMLPAWDLQQSTSEDSTKALRHQIFDLEQNSSTLLNNLQIFLWTFHKAARKVDTLGDQTEGLEKSLSCLYKKMAVVLNSIVSITSV